MKIRLQKYITLFFLTVCCVVGKAATFTVSSFDGSAPTSLSQGSPNYVVYYFSIVVPANTTFNPGVITVANTGNINSFATATLKMFVGANATPVTSTPLSTYSGNVNGSTTSFASINSITPIVQTTYFYYLILSMNTSANASPTGVMFSLTNAFTQNYTTTSTPNKVAVTNTNSKAYNIAANFHWLPVNNASVNWSNSSNWAIGTATATSGNANRVPAATDNVFIGVVAYNKTYQPTYDGTAGAASLTFGTAQTVSSNDVSAIKLTVNNALSISGDIIQRSNYNIPVNIIYLTEIAGTAAVTADNIVIGDGSAATINGTGSAAAVVWSNTSTLSKLTNDIQINGVYPSGAPNYILAGPGTFLLRNGTITCERIVLTNASTQSYSSFCLDLSSLRFSAVTNTLGAGTVKLLNANPYVAAAQGTSQVVLTTAPGSTNTTVEYGGAAQTVTTVPTGTAVFPASQYKYDNIVFSGSGVKTLNNLNPAGGTLTLDVDGSLSVNGSATLDCSANNAAINVSNMNNGGNALSTASGTVIKQGTGEINITGTLANAGTINGAAGNITASTSIANNNGIINLGTGTATTPIVQNNGGTINGSSTSGIFTISGSNFQNQDYNGLPSVVKGNAETINITGDYSNTGASTFTGGTGTVNFNKAGAQNLTDYSTSTGTVFTNVVFSGSGTKSLLGNAGTAGKFSVSPNGVLTMSSATTSTTTALAAGGFLTLKSTSTGSASVNVMPSNTSITGNVNVERYISPGRAWRLMASPVNGGKVTDLRNSIYITPIETVSSLGVTGYAGTNPLTILNYDNGSGQYVVVTSASQTFNAGAGFYLFFRGSRSNAQGKFVRSGGSFAVADPVTVTWTNTIPQGGISTNTAGATGRFVLVGNPYPCALDLGASAFFNNNKANYAFNGTTITGWMYDPATSSTNSAVVTNARYVSSGQAFFVKTTGTTGATTNPVKFTEDSKIVGTAFPLLMGAPVASTPDAKMLFKMTQDSLHSDLTMIRFNDSYNADYDESEEIDDLSGNGQTVFFGNMTADHKEVEVNSMPLGKNRTSVFLSVAGSASGIYAIEKLNLSGISDLYEVWLKDRFKNDSLDLRNYTTYHFNLDVTNPATYGNSRFEIIIRKRQLPPYELLSFTGEIVSGGNELKWKTLNDYTYTTYNLQKSTDGGQSYLTIKTIQSDSKGTYSFVDTDPGASVAMYKLMQNDVNEKITYSKVVILSSSGDNALFSVYPNPASSYIQYTLVKSAFSPSLQLNIYNSSGVRVRSGLFYDVTGQLGVGSLIQGNYLLELIDTKSNQKLGTAKFVKY